MIFCLCTKHARLVVSRGALKLAVPRGTVTSAYTHSRYSQHKVIRGSPVGVGGLWWLDVSRVALNWHCVQRLVWVGGVD